MHDTDSKRDFEAQDASAEPDAPGSAGGPDAPGSAGGADAPGTAGGADAPIPHDARDASEDDDRITALVGGHALDDDALVAASAWPDAPITIRANVVASLDGSVIGPDGRSGSLSSAADRRMFELLRRSSDLVMAGAGTLRHEGYTGLRVSDESAAWRVEHGLPPHPPLAIVTAHLSLPPDASVFTEAPTRPLLITGLRDEARLAPYREVATVIVSSDGVGTQTGADAPVGADAIDARTMRAELSRLGYRRVLCEGGPTLFGALAEQDALDEVCLSLAPRLVGDRGPRELGAATAIDRRFSLASVLVAADGMLLLRYARALAR